MTNTVAESTARVSEKEKVEKRRALGRGLESLLPGPRVVGGGLGQSVGGAGKQEIPHFVRNDKAIANESAGNSTSVSAVGSPQGAETPISIQAVVEPTAAAELRSA